MAKSLRDPRLASRAAPFSLLPPESDQSHGGSEPLDVAANEPEAAATCGHPGRRRCRLQSAHGNRRGGYARAFADSLGYARRTYHTWLSRADHKDRWGWHPRRIRKRRRRRAVRREVAARHGGAQCGDRCWRADRVSHGHQCRRHHHRPRRHVGRWRERCGPPRGAGDARRHLHFRPGARGPARQAVRRLRGYGRASAEEHCTAGQGLSDSARRDTEPTSGAVQRPQALDLATDDNDHHGHRPLCFGDWVAVVSLGSRW